MGANVARKIPSLASGYAYHADRDVAQAGDDKSGYAFVPNDDWDTVVVTPTDNERFVGTRWIDGSECNVWAHSGGWYAQVKVGE